MPPSLPSCVVAFGVPLAALAVGSVKAVTWTARTINREIRSATQSMPFLTQQPAAEAIQAHSIQSEYHGTALFGSLLAAIKERAAPIKSQLSRGARWIESELASLGLPVPPRVAAAWLLWDAFLLIRFLYNVKVAFQRVDSRRNPAVAEIALTKPGTKAFSVALLLAEVTVLEVFGVLALLWIESLCKPAAQVEEKQAHETAAEASAYAPSRVSHADVERVRLEDTHSEAFIQEESPVIDLTIDPAHGDAPSHHTAGVATPQFSQCVGDLSPLSDSVDFASPTDAPALPQGEIVVGALLVSSFQTVQAGAAPLLPPMAPSEEEQLPSPENAGAVDSVSASPPPLEPANGFAGGFAADQQQSMQMNGSGQMEVEIEPDFGGASGGMEDEPQQEQEEQEQEQAPAHSEEIPATLSLGGKNGDQADQLSKRKKRAPRPVVNVSEEEMERKYDGPASQTADLRCSARKRRKASADGSAVSTASDEKSTGAAQRGSGRKRGRSFDASADAIDLTIEEQEPAQEQDGQSNSEDEEEKEQSFTPGVQARRGSSGPSADGPPVYGTRSVTSPRARASASHSPSRRAHAHPIVFAVASVFSAMRRRSMDDGIEAENFALP